ncbi:AimR family lysis-lysogeny pheromone receptor [Bacillus licheniformis]|uniref:AimR family lysis-lysogeny pheromone receptor n=1 Tax=Bacillus subtilis TaxID=1423 RepID=UPI000BA6C652|nr:hypothetical protein CHH87_20990 [Bacillus licheniformis]TWK57292.1 hypothetical protein CHCC20342_1943 [Bacillus licheniformis]TWK96023.1 hypothetical protein CHCC20323_0788 [Bacillus licheniformis]
MVSEKNIRKHLKQVMESKNLTQKQVSANINISEAHLSKFMSGKEIVLSMVLDLVLFLDPENEVELMTNYLMEIKRKKNKRIALEYAHTRQIQRLSEYLIQQGLNDSNNEVREWSQIYQWQLQAKRTDYNEREFLNELKNFKAHSLEMEALLMILEMYGFFYNQKYEISYHYVEEIKLKLDAVTDPFIKKAFSVRLDEALAHIALKYNDDEIEARTAASRILDAKLGPTFDSTAFFILGLSYMTESYEDSYHFFKKCLLINKEIGRYNVVEDLKEQISILQLYWGQPVEFSQNIFIKQLMHGESSTVDYSSDKQKQAFLLLFEGIREADCDKLLLSMHLFVNNKDRFRARLPKIQLLKIDSFKNSNLKEVIML